MPVEFSPDLTRVFGPDMIARMQVVLEAAWNALHASESELVQDENRDATRLMLATRIVDLARAGETKHGRLLMGALEGFLPPGKEMALEPPDGHVLT